MKGQGVLRDGEVELHPLRQQHWRALERELLLNRDWLSPWEATSPSGLRSWDVRSHVRGLISQRREGNTAPFIIEVGGELIGQLNVFDISYGSVRSATIGYWVAERIAGRGVMTSSVALAIDFCFAELALHRVEINIRPNNAASLRVVEKLGLTLEGYKRRYIHIDGDWRDHYSYAVLRSDYPGGVLAAYRSGKIPDSRPDTRVVIR